MLEPIYKIRGDWPQPDRGATRSRRATRVDPRAEDRALQADRRRLRDRPATIRRSAYEALARALAEDPAERGHPDDASSGWRACSASWTIWSRATRRLVASVADRDAARTRSITRSRALAEVEPRATTSRRRRPTSRPWRCGRATSTAANALERSTCAAPTTRTWSMLLLRKAEIVDDGAEKKAARTTRRRRSTKRCWRARTRPSPSSSRCCRSTTSTASALDDLERLYIRLERWDDLKDVYAKKAELAPTPAEKKQMLFVLGQVYDRELDDPERAIETYSVDPRPRCRRLRRGAGARPALRQTERWYDLLAVLERQIELAPSPAEVRLAALPHRRAVAGAPQGPGRARSRPTARCSRSIRRTSRRCARSRR